MTARPRRALALGLILVAVGAGAPSAAAPPAGRVATYYLRSDSCGSSTPKGRLNIGVLDPQKGPDGATGCGELGGALAGEAIHQASELVLPGWLEGKEFHSNPREVRFPLRRGTVTGQLAARTLLPPVGGVGVVHFDVVLNVRTLTGRVLRLRTTAEALVLPGTTIARAPFRIDLREGAGTVVTGLHMVVASRGTSIGMDAEQYDGESWVSLPRAG